MKQQSNIHKHGFLPRQFKLIIYLMKQRTFHSSAHQAQAHVLRHLNKNKMSWSFLCTSQRSRCTSVQSSWSSVHLTVAVVMPREGVWVCVVEQPDEQGYELSILRRVGDSVAGIAEISVEHGLNGGAELPQQLPRLRGQLAVHQRATRKWHLHHVSSHWDTRGKKKKLNLQKWPFNKFTIWDHKVLLSIF